MNSPTTENVGYSEEQQALAATDKDSLTSMSGLPTPPTHTPHQGGTRPDDISLGHSQRNPIMKQFVSPATLI